MDKLLLGQRAQSTADGVPVDPKARGKDSLGGQLVTGMVMSCPDLVCQGPGDC
jgi:hypothetical protein